MPSIDATLAWAVPIKVEILGAHLQAYLNLRPTIDTLRLCHRRARANGVVGAFGRFPPELIVIVEECLIKSQRSELRKPWSADFKCYELKCKPHEHCDEDEFENAMSDAQTWQQQFPPEDEVRTIDNTELLDRYLPTLTDDGGSIVVPWRDIHEARQISWLDRVSDDGNGQRGWFDQEKLAMQKYFGLEVWTSHVRLQRYPENVYRSWKDEADPAQTTVAYLKLPGSYIFHNESKITTYEQESWYKVESGFGIPACIPEKPSAERFKRAIEILGLQPRIHRSQKAAARGAEKHMGSEIKVSSEPQLLMLVRAVSDNYE